MLTHNAKIENMNPVLDAGEKHGFALTRLCVAYQVTEEHMTEFLENSH